MNVKQINTAIITGTFTNDELTSMIDAVKFARSRVTHEIKNSLRIGDNVNFTSSKTGQNVTGYVEKIAIKYVTVNTIRGRWKVPANMLTKIANEQEYA